MRTVHQKILLSVLALIFALGAKADLRAPRLDGRLFLFWNDLRIPADEPAMLVAPGHEEIVKLRGRDHDLDLEVSNCEAEAGSCSTSGAVLGLHTPEKSGNYEIEFTVTEVRPEGKLNLGPPTPAPARRITLHLLVGFPNRLLVNGAINGFDLGIYPVNESLPWSSQVPAYFYRLDYRMVGLSLSPRLKLGDLGYDGRAPLPQYFTLDYELVKKLEVMADELKARHLPSRFHFIGGGFISPRSNAVRTSRNGAAATQSRHMWGEAVDFIIDDDRNEIMDDMNRDGVIDVRDTFVVRDLVTELEGEHKVKAGGFGVYSPPRNEALTMHVDVRGFATRWGYKEYDPKVFAGVPPKKSLRPGGS